MSEHTAPDTKRLVLILGGARSGKSSYAEQLAWRMTRGTQPIYLATATASDDEMLLRIANHRSARGDAWQTIEAPTDPATALRDSGLMSTAGVVVLDCLTLLISNLLLDVSEQPDDQVMPEPDELFIDTRAAEARIEEAISDLLAVYYTGARSLIIVSNEVGMGIVPAYPLGRVYRDALGRVNARVAAAADKVLLLLAGLPIEVKSLAAAWEAAATTALNLDK